MKNDATQEDDALFKDATGQVMRDAYNKLSDNGRLPATARQIMYAARPRILEMIDDAAAPRAREMTGELLKCAIRVLQEINEGSEDGEENQKD